MQINAKKIFRWFGEYDVHRAYPEKLFLIEQAIVAAMPESLRLSYLNDVYKGANVLFSKRPDPTSEMEVAAVAANVTKENSEAVVALINHHTRPTRKSKAKAIRELEEAVGASIAAVITLKRK